MREPEKKGEQRIIYQDASAPAEELLYHPTLAGPRFLLQDRRNVAMVIAHDGATAVIESDRGDW